MFLKILYKPSVVVTHSKRLWTSILLMAIFALIMASVFCALNLIRYVAFICPKYWIGFSMNLCFANLT